MLGSFWKKALSTFAGDLLPKEISARHQNGLAPSRRLVNGPLLHYEFGFTLTRKRDAQPDDLLFMINTVLGAVIDVVYANGGHVVDILGDEILALWPEGLAEAVPMVLRAAAQAVDATVAHPALLSWGLTVQPTVGLNAGKYILGSVGNSRRLKFAAMGDSVNLVGRLARMATLYGVQILATQPIIDACPRDITFREIDLIRVKGRPEPALVFEIMASAKTALTDA